ncbi:hypothetical protein T10_2529 [Trichinella papuae]|uniref:Uncharacterized protein n=1 Tax=Trichinella papuae TaxID=268474 RepID=A0A0V1MH78_9BILA|nr:hypothetical protein T10_2529 [Trichinella papuae]
MENFEPFLAKALKNAVDALKSLPWGIFTTKFHPSFDLEQFLSFQTAKQLKKHHHLKSLSLRWMIRDCLCYCGCGCIAVLPFYQRNAVFKSTRNADNSSVKLDLRTSIFFSHYPFFLYLSIYE